MIVLTLPLGGNQTLAADTDADLSITKSGSPSSLLVGGTITYDYTIRNAGPQDAQNTRLHDTLPAGISFQALGPATGGGVCAYSFAPRALECLWSGDLASGASVQAYITIGATYATD